MVQHVTVGGIQVAYDAIGDGAPLILLHGGEGDHSLFNGVIPALGRSFRAIAYDQRDCGATVWTPDTPYGLTDLADEAAGFIEALGYERAHVLGHSAGGLVAQVLAARWPQRIDRLILEVTMSPLVARDHFDSETLQKRKKYIEEGDDLGLAGLFSTPEYVEKHPELVGLLKDIRGNQTSEQLSRRMNALQGLSELDYSKIISPTLVFAGERDQIVPPVLAKRMADSIPGAAFELFPDAGHLGIIQDPAKFVEVVVGFLKAE